MRPTALRLAIRKAAATDRGWIRTRKGSGEKHNISVCLDADAV